MSGARASIHLSLSTYRSLRTTIYSGSISFCTPKKVSVAHKTFPSHICFLHRSVSFTVSAYLTLLTVVMCLSWWRQENLYFCKCATAKCRGNDKGFNLWSMWASDDKWICDYLHTFFITHHYAHHYLIKSILFRSFRALCRRTNPLIFPWKNDFLFKLVYGSNFLPRVIS